MKMFVGKPRAPTAASFAVSNVLIKFKKSFSDGEIVKDAFLVAVEFLFAEFTNKSKILSAITETQLFRSVSRRVEDIAVDLSSQLYKNILSHKYFLLQFDESCNSTGTAQSVVYSDGFTRFLLKKSI